VIHLLFYLALLTMQPSGEIELQVSSLKKSGLPDDFPFQILHQGFAVLKLTVKNSSPKEWNLQLSDSAVFSSKGKKIERALSTDIAPKIVELYSKTSRGIHSEGYIGGRPTPSQMNRAPTIQTAPGVRSVSASIGHEVRKLLESFEIAEGILSPGDEASGLFYLKSEKSGTALEGGRFQLGSVSARF
jgi:hypothetical protein